MNHSPTLRTADPVWMLDLMSEPINRFRVADRVITYCNTAWAMLYGADHDTVVGAPLDEFLSTDELQGMHAQLARLGPECPVLTDDIARAVPWAEDRWLQWVDHYVVTDDGPEVLSVGRDVTERHLLEQRLAAGEQRFRSLADNTSDIVWRVRTSPEVHFDYVSPSVAEVLGHPPEIFLEDFARVVDIATPETRDLISGLIAGTPLPERIDLGFRHVDGRLIIGETTLVSDGEFVQGIVRDVTELRRQHVSMVALAGSDPLTGLANRRRFDEVLAGALERTERNCSTLAVVYIDLDDLKQINDRHGHDAGDDVLRETARRLVSGADRADVVARLGGDEFAVVQQVEKGAASDLAAHIESHLSVPIEVRGGVVVACAASVGVADTATCGRRPDDLVAAADRAMYAAKRRGAENDSADQHHRP